MTDTKKGLYERIAEQEGWIYSRARNKFSTKSSSRSRYFTTKYAAFELIEKYDLGINPGGNGAWCVYVGGDEICHKNLENAVMLAALSISEGE